MSIEIKTPTFPESISDGTVAVWHHAPGEHVERDELLVDIETDKVVLEIVAPIDGQLSEILKNEGDIVLSEELLARFEAGAGGEVAPTPSVGPAHADVSLAEEVSASPAARKLASESQIDIQRISGSGKSGRITKADVVRAVAQQVAPAKPEAAPPTPVEAAPATGARVERRVTMTRLRASIARRLVEAQQNAAMLTTFNEVDMAPIMALRRQYQEEFQARHNGTKLGFMSFFVRASVEALKRFPAVNASIDDNDIVLRCRRGREYRPWTGGARHS
jgi:2-oxoglutarate dehydrogenase E2 component (dihydrolipoamide succinyltransferase)